MTRSLRGATARDHRELDVAALVVGAGTALSSQALYLTGRPGAAFGVGLLGTTLATVIGFVRIYAE